MARHRGFTVLELLVVIGIIAVLLAILLPMAERVRHQAYIDKCASNLRQIGMSLSIYEQENNGNYPRTRYNPLTANTPTKGTGANSPDPFQVGTAVAENDLTAPLFLLLKTQKLPPEIMICPYNDETSFVADIPNYQGRSNFTDQKKNLGYSFANPYPNPGATGYRLSNKMPAQFAIGADKNPGNLERNHDVYAPSLNSPTAIMQKGNSVNHEGDGQNVLYSDGHVSWEKTPFAGIGQDNIFTAKNGTPPTVEMSPADASDSILLPTDD